MAPMSECMLEDWCCDSPNNEYVTCCPESPARVYDLDTYATIYENKFGLFFGKLFFTVTHLREGIPCGLCRPEIETGAEVNCTPLLVAHDAECCATVEDAFELAPVSWPSTAECPGPCAEDEQNREFQRKMGEKSNSRQRESSLSVSVSTKACALEQFQKKGSWQVTFDCNNEAPRPRPKKRTHTSNEIQTMFGLSDCGGLILNMDHIVVVQGRCGLNRGKAIGRFLVPLGEDAMADMKVFRFLRSRWHHFCRRSSIVIDNMFGEPAIFGCTVSPATLNCVSHYFDYRTVPL